MNSNNLSLRLDTVASFVAQYGEQPIRLADIGSDHAYLPCNLILNNLISYSIAGEVVRGPFESAQSEVAAQGLTEQIDVRFGDGLEVVEASDEINTVTICGMGGILIRDILHLGYRKLTAGHLLVLQPNIAEEQLRTWLIEHQYSIIDEEIVHEHGHYYEIIVAKSTENKAAPLTQEELLFGPKNLENQTETFKAKWAEELKSFEYILSSMKESTQPIERKIKALEEKINFIRKVIQNEDK